MSQPRRSRLVSPLSAVHFRRALACVGAVAAGWAARPAVAQPAPAAPSAVVAPGTAATDSKSQERPEGAPGESGAAASVAHPVLSPEVTARIDEIEQSSRIALRKQEILEEEIAKRTKEAPVSSVDDKGFSIKSGDGAYILRLRGTLQVDGRFFLEDKALKPRDTFLIRRFRPQLDGTLFGLVDFRFVPDFAGSTAVVFDAYVDVHPAPWARLRIGKMKQPLGLERLQSDPDLSLIERALTQNLSNTRDVGAQLWGDVADAVVHYSIGIFNGGADNTNSDVDVNYAKDFAGRLLFQPFRPASLKFLGSLGLGIAASTGNRRGTLAQGTTTADTQLPSFRTFGQREFFRYAASTTAPANTVIARGRASRLNPQFYYFNGPFGLLAEYIWSRQEVDKAGARAELTHRAGHATLSFALGGVEGLDGVTPTVAFDRTKGTWGALELAARASALWIDDDTYVDQSTGSVGFADLSASSRRAVAWAVGANYVPRRSFRLAVGFEQTRFKGGAGTTAAPTDKKTENALVGRAQVNF